MHGPPSQPPSRPPPPEEPDALQARARRWQVVRTWARLIREAEGLWHVEGRELHRVASQELLQLVQEVPPSLRRRVNLWLKRLHVATRLH